MDIKKKVEKIIELLECTTKNMPSTMTNKIIKIYGRNPFLILISCLLSLRAKDVVTFDVSKKLFALASTPQDILSIDLEKLRSILRPLGFYRRKSDIIKNVSKVILEEYNGQVPSSRKELLSIKGVGPKTASLVLAKAFNIPAICVDVHVHRISNRLGLVNTKTPEETEKELEKIVPIDKWTVINDLFVVWGQNVCVSRSPFCSECILSSICPKLDIKNSR